VTAKVILDMIDNVRVEHPELIIVLATHDVAVAARAQRRIEIVDGRLVEAALRR
jgi:predicted ABC-type transport system involved in lysophospholipase L1 biosynthesis ATPase subunit